MWPRTARTLEARHDSSPCLDRGMNVVVIGADVCNGELTGDVAATVTAAAGYTNTSGPKVIIVRPQSVLPINLMVALRGGRDDMRTCFGVGNENDPQFTISAAHSHGVCYGGVSPTVCARAGTGGNRLPLVVLMRNKNALNDMLPVVESYTGGVSPPRSTPATTKAPVPETERRESSLPSERKYVLRRLTPVECLRLQGFPDSWCNLQQITELADEEAAFWEENRRQRAEMQGKEYKPISREALIKWLNSLGSDSSVYKAAGNSLNLPCAADVIGRIVKFVESEGKC